MDRRAFIGTLTGGLLVTPHAAWAQQAGKVWRIGFVGTETTSINGHFLAAFRQGMRELGYVEKQTLTVEDRWAEGRSEDFHGLIADLIRLKVDVLVPPQYARRPRSKSPHDDDSDCLCNRLRPGPVRLRHQPQPAWWQRNRRGPSKC